MDSPLVWIFTLMAVAAALELVSRRVARRGARNAVADADALFDGVHRFVSIDPAAFGWLDQRFYADTQARLAEQGFRFLGDVEDLTVTEQHPSLRTFVRVMSGDGGEVTLGIYQVKLRGVMAVFQWIGVVPRRLKILDVSTELSDGRFLCTSNTQGVDTTPSPASIDLERLPPDTPIQRTLERHRERLSVARRETPGLDPRRVGSLNEALAAQDRLHRLKSALMLEPEALVQTIRAAPGGKATKQWMIDEVRRTTSRTSR